MVRFARILAILLCFSPAAAFAEDGGTSNGPAGDEMKIMRQMLEQQSKQIDVLAQEIARLNMLLEGRASNGSEPVTNAAPSAAPTAENSAANEPPPKAIPLEDQPAAKPTPSGPMHIVAKGETLTAIAKRYKVTVPELLKVNKIADVRKLQIGQSVILPPNAKVPASPTPSAQPQ